MVGCDGGGKGYYPEQLLIRLAIVLPHDWLRNRNSCWIKTSIQVSGKYESEKTASLQALQPFCFTSEYQLYLGSQR